MKKLLFLPSILLIPFISCKKTSKDKTAPIITLIGDASVYVNKGTTYVDARSHSLWTRQMGISQPISL